MYRLLHGTRHPRVYVLSKVVSAMVCFGRSRYWALSAASGVSSFVRDKDKHHISYNPSSRTGAGGGGGGGGETAIAVGGEAVYAFELVVAVGSCSQPS